ncbi:quinone oxidoreductase [Methylobacterium mesophilicum SR1.6/6]|uniref:Quinone oxidoreductase n=1 Tax=Methylobacterium mesophilicum SR1.6/6 TaxID=908290 RepID=A0A6B9FLN9_9HYPH|nr:quinone oxidoreductase [Methylobacterium mesophilicum]QGY01838.1 quinone oxidoreductase [Methylobacterium mesophilicum SR1.6/6]
MRETSTPGRPATMRALRVQEWGDLSQINLEEAAVPRPEPGEVLVRMKHSGVNFMDVYTVRGAYRASRTYPLKVPLTIGMEGAGHVAALGEGVDTISVGDRVSFCLQWGAHAEWTAVPAAKLARLPDTIDTETAAAVTFQGITAHYLAHDLAVLRAADWALVWSGAGGIAQLLTQMLRRVGIRVVATASSEEKADIARRNGAEAVLSPDDPDFVERIRDVTGGGAAIVFDSAGRDTIERSIRCLKRRGTLVLVGTNSGAVPSLDVSALMDAGSISFIRPRLADFITTPGEFNSRVEAVFAMIASGKLAAIPAAVFPIAEAHTPLQQLVDRVAIGKSVLDVGTV